MAPWIPHPREGGVGGPGRSTAAHRLLTTDVTGISPDVRGLNARSPRRDVSSPLGRAINLSDDSPGTGVTKRFLRSARISVLRT